jgi:hypothetical protein
MAWPDGGLDRTGKLKAAKQDSRFRSVLVVSDLGRVGKKCRKGERVSRPYMLALQDPFTGSGDSGLAAANAFATTCPNIKQRL